jgi:hypothetical protein
MKLGKNRQTGHYLRYQWVLFVEEGAVGHYLWGDVAMSHATVAAAEQIMAKLRQRIEIGVSKVQDFTLGPMAVNWVQDPGSTHVTAAVVSHLGRDPKRRIEADEYTQWTEGELVEYVEDALMEVALQIRDRDVLIKAAVDELASLCDANEATDIQAANRCAALNLAGAWNTQSVNPSRPYMTENLAEHLAKCIGLDRVYQLAAEIVEADAEAKLEDDRPAPAELLKAVLGDALHVAFLETDIDWLCGEIVKIVGDEKALLLVGLLESTAHFQRIKHDCVKDEPITVESDADGTTVDVVGRVDREPLETRQIMV